MAAKTSRRKGDRIKVAVAHNAPISGKPDSEDVLQEVGFVETSLKRLDYEYNVFPFPAPNVKLSPEEAVFHFFIGLGKYSPDVVFNLIEEGNAADFPVLLEHFDYSFTGSGYEAVLTTNNKSLSKLIMGSFNITTPPYQIYRGQWERLRIPPPWIIKPSMEDASVGIDEQSIFQKEDDLRAALPGYHRRHGGQPVIVERFIEGREFNVSLLETTGGKVEVLPVAEMQFRNWPADKPRLVGYRAKWEKGSFEYENTIRRFEPADAPLSLLRETALRAWGIFDLRGYGRVDMMLDEDGAVHVLEVNANPCISEDSGFTAALREGGYSDDDFVRQLIGTAMER